MYLRMQRHASRSDSASHQLLMRVPRDVAPHVKGRSVTIDLPASPRDPAITVSFKLGSFAKCSLRTRDAATADTRRLAIVAHLSKVYEAARHGAVTLSHRQIIALSGEVYRRLRQTHDENPGSPEQWAAWKAFTRAALEGRLEPEEARPIPWHPCSEEQAAARYLFAEDLTAGVDTNEAGTYDDTALRERCGRLALWVLQEHGIEADGPSHLALLREVAKAALQAGWQLKRQASGDYRPDPMEGRFPSQQTATSSVTLPGLFEKWQKEAKPAASTLTTWRGVVSSLVKFVEHDDVARLTPKSVVAWKDSLVASELSAKTINDSYLAGLRALLNYGIANKLVRENVATGVKVVARRRAGTSMQPYTDDELKRLLILAAAETLPARNWLPLLQATSGARVGELAQLWGSRVREIDGIPVMVLSPAEDGGSFKNEGSERTVPLHPVVIEAGFLEFVRSKGRGPLFYGRNSQREGSRHASKGTANHLATWIREQGFTDPRKAPNHALRHWFKSAAARSGVADSIADHLQGHATRSDSATYRHFDIETLAAAMNSIRIPR